MVESIGGAFEVKCRRCGGGPEEAGGGGSSRWCDSGDDTGRGNVGSVEGGRGIAEGGGGCGVGAVVVVREEHGGGVGVEESVVGRRAIGRGVDVVTVVLHFFYVFLTKKETRKGCYYHYSREYNGLRFFEPNRVIKVRLRLSEE